jgi:beta-mannosidase
MMKIKHALIGLCAVWLMSSCASKEEKIDVSPAQMPATISLNGQWQFLSAGSLKDVSIEKALANKAPANVEWKSINVPGNWYREGFDVHGKVYYKKNIFLDKNLQGKRVNLVFNGVDYITHVWVNGQQQGSHEGYFQRFNVDISKAVKYGQENELLVQVDSPLEKPEDFSLRKRWLKGIFSHHDTRPGGAWSERGQERNTGGIWNDVELHISEQIYAKHLISKPVQLSENKWQLNNQLVLDGTLPAGAEIQWQLTPVKYAGMEHDGQVLTGSSKHTQFTIQANNPALWWPVGFGKPNLYELDVKIVQAGKVLETINTRTAFRRVELDENKVWKINGQRLQLRGTNYIATQWLAEMSREDFARDVELMKAAHINTVRVHAHITAPDFYKICDEQGIMIWQDFPLQWGYQDTPAFHQQAMSQLGDMLEQFANHPSIIHWSLHNEPPWDADWMKWKYPDYDPQQNKRLDEKLFARAKKLETSRPVSMYSATHEHPWLGWYSGHWLDYVKPTDQAFIAEFGAQALPDKQILKKILQGDIAMPAVTEEEKKAQWKSWEKWQYHNFQPRETFEIAKVEPGNHTDDLITNTQHYQARLIQLAAESYRRQAYQPVTALFQFMFVEDWESMNWGVVDYWRNAKPGYASLQLAYQPILPSLEWSQMSYAPSTVNIGLWALNDTSANYRNVSYRIRLKQQDKTLDEQMFLLGLEADSHQRIRKYTTPELQAGEYQLYAELLDEQGNRLGHNHYEFKVASNNDKSQK